MIRRKRTLTTALASAAALMLGACGGSDADTSTGPVGDPVTGGTATVIQMNEPSKLDPAAMGNAYAITPILGNALYGTLMINDPVTAEIEYKMAEDFSTADGGKTFELTLRPGLEFTDGTPLDAAAVKYNWDRIKDPETGSSYLPDAMSIESTKVVDETTLKITLVEPVPNFAQLVVGTAFNWIASPAALEKGEQAFDANPVGAGPYTLKNWIRNGSIELVRNPGYWDAPKPYLDTLIVKSSTDPSQRVNSVISGNADVALESSWAEIAKAAESGLTTDTMPLNGGVFLSFNLRRPPFDDVRARQAVASALDLAALDEAIYQGNGKIPSTLFTESSPFYSDIKLTEQDHDMAQELFDELAADGKPVEFTVKAYPSTENKITAEAVQAQLSAFENVTVKVEVIDISERTKLHTEHDFDMVASSAFFVDPEPRLWQVFHGESPVNMPGIDDKELNAALDAGRTATSTEDRKAAYDDVQKRMAEVVPVVFYTRAGPTLITAPEVHGVQQYGNGSPLPEELWIQE